jgi:hypothetical protein
MRNPTHFTYLTFVCSIVKGVSRIGQAKWLILPSSVQSDTSNFSLRVMQLV